MRCNKCGVEIGESNICPLCHQKLDNDSKITIINNFPPKQKPKPLPPKISIKNIYLIIALAVAIITICCCYLIKPFTYHWCWFVVAILAYGYLLIANTIFSHSEIGAKIIMQGICLIALCYIYDAIFKTYVATPYCLSIIISFMIAISGLNLIIFYKHNRSLFVSCNFISLLGFLPIILNCFYDVALIPAIIAASLGGLTLLCSVIFGIRRLKEQFEKVFHI